MKLQLILENDDIIFKKDNYIIILKQPYPAKTYLKFVIKTENDNQSIFYVLIRLNSKNIIKISVNNYITDGLLHIRQELLNDMIYNMLKIFINKNIDKNKNLLFILPISTYEEYPSVKRAVEYSIKKLLIENNWHVEKHFNTLYFYKNNPNKEKILVNNIEAKKLAENIYKNCQKFLKDIYYDIDNYKLFRGIKTNKGLWYKGITRLKDRKPKDMSIVLHNNINNIIEQYFGKPFRNSLFVSGSISIAKGYSKRIDGKKIKFDYVYNIFPIGNYEYLWNTAVEDLYSYIDDITDFENFDEMLNNYLDNLVHNDDMISAITSGHEIMIWTDKYYAILANSDFEEAVIRELKKLFQ